MCDICDPTRESLVVTHRLHSRLSREGCEHKRRTHVVSKVGLFAEASVAYLALERPRAVVYVPKGRYVFRHLVCAIIQINCANNVRTLKPLNYQNSDNYFLLR